MLAVCADIDVLDVIDDVGRDAGGDGGRCIAAICDRYDADVGRSDGGVVEYEPEDGRGVISGSRSMLAVFVRVDGAVWWRPGECARRPSGPARRESSEVIT